MEAAVNDKGKGKTDIGVYQFGDSSDSEGQSQPKFLVPSTPRGRNIFSKSKKTVPFTPSFKKQPGTVSFTPPSPRTSAKPNPNPAPISAKPSKSGKKSKEVDKTGPVNFDEVMVVSSDLDSN